MHRTTLSLIRNFTCPSFLVAMAFILKAIVVNMADSAHLAGLVTPFSWVPLAVFSIGLLFALHTGYRTWRWSEGLDLACDCGGMLGSVRDGIRGRSDYRKCLGCGRNHSVHG
jgi:hypothetical protein